MKEIDRILEIASKNPCNIPPRVEHKIDYTLRNKNKYKTKHNLQYYFKRIAVTATSVVGVLIGSFSVYAISGGTIDGIPATDWLGIKFSDKYVDYKAPVENQAVAFGDTSVNFTSTMCSEGITILEFDVKLSQDDYNNFMLGQTAYTEEFYNKIQDYKKEAKPKAIKKLRADKYSKYVDEQLSNGKPVELDITSSQFDVTDEEFESSEYYSEYLAELQRYDEQVEARKNTGFMLGLALNTNQIGGIYNYDKYNPNMEWYSTIYVDDEPYYVTNFQKLEKISDYEYKIYTMYSLTDDELKGKDTFKITLKNNKLVSLVDWAGLQDGWRGNCQWFTRDSLPNDSVPEQYVKDLPLDFETTVSKDSILNDSKIIDNPEIKSEFRNITHTVEKVVVSPVQTIVKINHSASQQSSNSYGGRYANPDIEHLPLTREYKAYDANGKELNCFSTTNKNTLIYSDGTREDYDRHDIPNKKYSNATWEQIYYLLIENTDTDYIKIVPIETIRNPLNKDDNPRGEIHYEMEALTIQLK